MRIQEVAHAAIQIDTTGLKSSVALTGALNQAIPDELFCYGFCQRVGVGVELGIPGTGSDDVYLPHGFISGQVQQPDRGIKAGRLAGNMTPHLGQGTTMFCPDGDNGIGPGILYADFTIPLYKPSQGEPQH